MLRRLVDNDISLYWDISDIDKVNWWLSECINPDYLVDLCLKYQDLAHQQSLMRPLLKAAIKADRKKLGQLLEREREKEQERQSLLGSAQKGT